MQEWEKNQTLLKRQLSMFGCYEQDIREGCHDRPSMYVLSVLSDAQELIALGEKERARQLINRAKFVIHEYAKFVIPTK